MGKQYEQIDGRLRELILAQPVFFVGTVPAAPDGHLNISPKGLLGSFVVLDEHRVAYLDYGGSGAETIAHLRDDGRIVLMFCAFAGPPNIVRLHGRGTVHFDDSLRFAELLPLFGEPATLPRTIIEVAVTRVADSCGYSVPLMGYEGDRDLLPRYWERKTPQDVVRYRVEKNATSIDGLPAIPVTEPATIGRVGGEAG
jgi:hypothetical protein